MLKYFSSIVLQEEMIGALVRLPQSLTANERELGIRWALNLCYNPVEAGLVWKTEDHCYFPAFDYAGGKGYLDVDLIQ